MVEPAFSLKIVSASGAWRVAINDVPLFLSPDGAGGTVTMPVAHWLVEGNNELSVGPAAALGPAVPRDTISVRLFAHRPAETSVDHGTLAHLSFEPDESPPWRIAEDQRFPGSSAGAIELRGDVAARQRFRVALPMVQPYAWTTSTKIGSGEGLRETVVEFYRSIWTLIQERNLPALRGLFRERQRELRAAFGADVREVPDDRGLSELYDEGWVAAPFDPENGELEFGAEQRLVRLRRWDGLPLLYLERGNLGEYLDIWLRHDGTRWHVTR